MSYEKTIWANDDKITSERMNKIEDALNVEDNVFIVNIIPIEVSTNSYYWKLDKNYSEIHNAVLEGKSIIGKYQANYIQYSIFWNLWFYKEEDDTEILHYQVFFMCEDIWGEYGFNASTETNELISNPYELTVVISG